MGSGEKGIYFQGAGEHTGNYFQGSGEQAHSFGDLGRGPCKKLKNKLKKSHLKGKAISFGFQKNLWLLARMPTRPPL